jgi:soluble epoxide hydrolase / lipid-phosphate phosphatase
MAYPHSTYTTARALTYSYIHIPPQLPNTQYILFLHGFPSTSYHWRYQISFFVAKGYGILAPDLLGFGETSKPNELEMYRGEAMARDIVEIMVLEDVGVVVGVAHDWYVLRFILSYCLPAIRFRWFLNERRVKRCAEIACNYANASSTRGSFLLSRLANYHPERFSAYAFIDHGYIAPGRGLTTAMVKHIDSQVQANLGFSIFGYFLFFDEEDAPKLLDEHVSLFQTLQILTCQTLRAPQAVFALG